METFLVPRLVEWKEKRAARVLAGKDLSPAAYEEEGEQSSSESGESKDHDGGDSRKGSGASTSKNGEGS